MYGAGVLPRITSRVGRCTSCSHRVMFASRHSRIASFSHRVMFASRHVRIASFSHRVILASRHSRIASCSHHIVSHSDMMPTRESRKPVLPRHVPPRQSLPIPRMADTAAVIVSVLRSPLPLPTSLEEKILARTRSAEATGSSGAMAPWLRARRYAAQSSNVHHRMDIHARSASKRRHRSGAIEAAPSKRRHRSGAIEAAPSKRRHRARTQRCLSTLAHEKNRENGRGIVSRKEGCVQARGTSAHGAPTYGTPTHGVHATRFGRRAIGRAPRRRRHGHVGGRVLRW